MNIEEEIFKKANILYDKLIPYGFLKEKDYYYLEKEFLNGEFKALITITKNKVIGKVIDLETSEEYFNIRVKKEDGSFVNKVREAYKDLLLDIKNNCCEEKYFVGNQSNRITTKIIDKYNAYPEFLWEKCPDFGIFRKPSGKWFVLIMNLDYSKITNKKGEVEVMNLKLPREEIPNLIKKKGYYEAYHMSKKDWITIVLNDSLQDEEIELLIDKSYNIVK